MPAEAPVAPPAGAPNIVPAARTVNIPPAPGVIHVTAPTEPAAAPKPGGARDRMMTALREKAAPKETPPAAATPPAKTEAPTAPETTETPAEAAPPAGSETNPAAQVPADKKKVNPWKLVDEHKARAAKAEQEAAELRKLVGDEAARKAELERLSRAESRNKELEDHIRFVDYSKSQEFQEKFEKPYEQAFQRAMAEVGELTVQDNNGQERAVTPMDILELVNLPLGKARQLANESFGDFADDVMQHRNRIRQLWDSRSQALEEAKKTGAEREKAVRDKLASQHKEVTDFVTKQWTAANESITKDEKYGRHFVPVEGDQEGNQRLAKGFELVDRAFAENPMDPRLKPEERAAVIKRHAAVRNRAAAFGRLNWQNQQLQEKITKLETELKKFQASTPETTSEQPAVSGAEPNSARASVFGALRKMAK